MQGHSNIMLQ